MPAEARRHFLSWDRPLLPQAVAYLATGWSGDGPLDLGALLVVVPTRQAGRRLREALAAHAEARGQAVFAPRVITPEGLIEPTGATIAPPVESLLAWAAVWREVNLDGCRDVLPADPPARSMEWALGLARRMTRLQRELAEGGLRLADVAERAGDFPENDRWRQLGALEEVQAARLRRAGRVDATAGTLAAAEHPALPAGIGRIVVLAVPDPLPLALRALTAHARTVPVDVVVHAPESEAEQFDAWGRPLPEAWARRVLEIPEFEQRVHLCPDPSTQADWLVAQARAYAGTEGRLAMGLAAAEVIPAAEGAFRREGLPVFNPEGRARGQEGFFHLLDALAAFVRAPEFPAVAALARCPAVLDHLASRVGGGFSVARWLEALDELQARHLPADLAAARRHATGGRAGPELAAGLEALAKLRELAVRGGFAAGAVAALGAIFEDAPASASASAVGTAEAWMEIVRSCAAAEPRWPEVAREDWWRLALAQLADSRQADEKPAGAWELQGWLELPWEDAPHLVVAGLNDGFVPEAVAGDAFLPEALRERLGLKSNAARFARDAYLLQALAAARAEGGRLDVLYGKFSAEGEPLRPSRLLLRCPDPDLPARVDFLFRAPELPGPAVAWRRAWRLRVPRREPPARVAVTALRAWLRCPLRFHLRHGLGMEAVDPFKSEMDAFDFGTACHGALEAMARDAGLRDCAEAATLRAFLLAEFDRRMRARFGAELTLPLLVQAESAHQRLGHAAEVQARERAAGWAIVEVERKFELPVGGLVVVGKIDRLERHEKTGAWRVLDYKTSDTAIDPSDAHLRNRRKDEVPPEWALLSGGKAERVWVDLQLPIYERVVAAEADGAPVACGYFNLPKAVGETGLRLWDDYGPGPAGSAWRCVEGVVAAIRAGEFWPPRELTGRDAEFDEFAALFHGGAAASVEWEGRQP